MQREYSGDSFEHAVIAAASVTTSAAHTGVNTRFVTHDVDLRGPDVAANTLRWLAMVEPVAEATEIASMMNSGMSEGMGLVVIVTGSSTSAAVGQLRSASVRTKPWWSCARRSTRPARRFIVDATSTESLIASWSHLIVGSTQAVHVMTATATATARTRPINSDEALGHVPATLALTFLTFVTAISLCRVFPDWAYLRPMLVVCFGVHAVMYLFRVLEGQRVAGPADRPRRHGSAHRSDLLPRLDAVRSADSETIDQFRISMRLVWRQFPRAVSPVPSEGSFAIAATTALGICAWLADSFAFRAYGRAEAVVPAGVVFIFTSALGVDRNRVLVAALWVGAAILTIAALRMAHARDDSAWMGKRRQSLWSALPAAVACALFATTGAVAVAPQLPGAGDKALLDTRNRDGDVTEVVSPLVDIRSRLVNRGNVELFTVDTKQPRYLGLTSLAQFDGTRWTPLPEDLRTADGTLSQPQPNSELLLQQITISRLGGNYAPAARTPTSASWSGRTLSCGEQSGALIVDGGLEPGYQYQVTSPDFDPSPNELRSASTIDRAPNPIYYDFPTTCRSEVRDLAANVTAQAPTPYDKARALQDWFRTQLRVLADGAARPQQRRDAELPEHQEGILRAVLRHVRGHGPRRSVCRLE